MAWPSNVKLALKCENNNNDDTGNYTPTDVGTPVYSSSVKHDDDYAFERLVGDNCDTNCIALPSDLMTYMNTLDEFSISFWLRTPENDYAHFHSKGSLPFGDAGEFGGWINPELNQTLYAWNGDSWVVNQTFNVDTWYNLAFVWEGTAGSTGTLKYYVNNSLIATQTGVYSSFQANNVNYYVGGGIYSSVAGRPSFLDNYIITNDAPSSFPVEEISRIYRVINNDGLFSTSLQNRILR